MGINRPGQAGIESRQWSCVVAFIPSIVPQDDDTVYSVEDDYGELGRCWRETDSDKDVRRRVAMLP